MRQLLSEVHWTLESVKFPCVLFKKYSALLRAAYRGLNSVWEVFMNEIRIEECHSKWARWVGIFSIYYKCKL